MASKNEPVPSDDGLSTTWLQRKADIEDRLREAYGDGDSFTVQEFKPSAEDDNEGDEGADRHLFGSKYDEYTCMELHWNALRNFFPQWMRMQEGEDAETDAYCDMLGPRTQSIKPFNKVSFGVGRKDHEQDGAFCKSVEAYRMDEMQSLILPQWEYRRPGTQMKGMAVDEDDEPYWHPPMEETQQKKQQQSKAVEAGDTEMTMKDGEHAKSLHRNGKFPPMKTLEHLQESKTAWGQVMNKHQGGDVSEGEPPLYPYVHYADKYSTDQFIKSRYINHPHLLPSKFYDRPNEMGDGEVEPTDPYGNEDVPPEGEQGTVKGRIGITKYLMKQIKNSKILKVWEKRRDQTESGSDSLPYLEGVPALDRTQDKYELATWSWLHRRVYGEDEEVSKRMIILMINVTVQVLTALSLWGLGFAEIDGGRLDVVIVSFTTGIVGLISGLVGLAGIIAKSEEYLRIFYVAQLWMISVLVSFLYAQARYAGNTTQQCGATNTGLSPNHDDGCSEQKARVNAAIALSCVELVLAWMSVYACSAILDGINDQSALEDNIECFKYLQYYLNELLRRCQMKCPAKRQNRPTYLAEYDHVDSLRGPEMGLVDISNSEVLKDLAVEDHTVTCGKVFGELLAEAVCLDSGNYRPHLEKACYTREDFEDHFGESLGDRTQTYWDKCIMEHNKEWEDAKVEGPSFRKTADGSASGKMD